MLAFTQKTDLSGPKLSLLLRLQSILTPRWLLPTNLMCSLVVVPLYDTLGPDASAYVINHAELSIVVSSGENTSKVA